MPTMNVRILLLINVSLIPGRADCLLWMHDQKACMCTMFMQQFKHKQGMEQIFIIFEKKLTF